MILPARPVALLAALVGLAAILWCVGGSPAAAAEPRRFDGVRLRIATVDAAAIGGPVFEHVSSWAKRSGGQATVVAIPYERLFDTLQASLRAGRPDFDVIFYVSGWTADLYPHLAELPAGLADDEYLDDIHPTYRDRLMRWNGRLVALTVDGDLYLGYYRKDLFENLANRHAFEARYGYELAPPVTWTQYRNIAQFFTGRSDRQGNALHGTAEPFAAAGQQFWDVSSRAAVYTNPPGSRGRQFFDPDTLKPQIDHPGWVRAVNDYIEILAFCPPGSERFATEDARAAFLGGRTAMTLDWSDTGPLAEDPERSAVAGMVGYFMLPGAMRSWDSRSGAWITFQQAYQVPFLADGGWVASVPATSLHPLAAWDFIKWYASPENSLNDAIRPNSGISPYRLTHFTHIDAWTQALPGAAAARYLQVIMGSLDSPRAVPDLHIPGFNEYTRAFEREVSAAVNGQRPVEEALARAAAEWDSITERHGRAMQRAAYRTAMGLDR